MTRPDPVALFSTLERQFDETRAPGAVAAPPHVIEALWHERQIRQQGQLTAITIPLAGAAPEPDYGPQLAAVLDQRWTGRFDLTAGAKILSITARVDRAALGTASLVLTFITDTPLEADGLASARIAAELRRAMRDLRRGYALPQPIAA